MSHSLHLKRHSVWGHFGIAACYTSQKKCICIKSINLQKNNLFSPSGLNQRPSFWIQKIADKSQAEWSFVMCGITNIMSIAKCHKESRLSHSRCIMWFKALSWQGPFSSLTLSVKTGAESREKKTRLWFTMKPKRVFALALRYTIVTALDHLQWRVITPTLSSFKQILFPQKKQACIKIHSVVSFGERHGFYVNSGRPILWDFHARTSQRSYI